MWDLQRVEEAFARAAVDPASWTAAMDVAAKEAESTGAVLLPIKGQLPNVPVSESLTQLFTSYFHDGWFLREERARGLSTMMRRGAYSDFDFISPDEISRNMYYQELLATYGFKWFAGVKMAWENEVWILSIQRESAADPFSMSEVHKLSQLSRRIASAGALAQALGFARAEAAMEAFEASGSAVILLDRLGQVLRVNLAAERLIGSDLQITLRHLRSYDHAATRSFEQALHQLLWSASSSALMPPVLLPRREGRPVLGYLLRLPSVTRDALASCQAVLVLVDLERRTQPPEDHLRIVFGLSNAEARLAALLASGASLEDAATQLEVRKETVRSQLKSILAKTETARQAELVALLGRLRSIQGPQTAR